MMSPKTTRLKQHLSKHFFQTKDVGCLKYFLGIEVTQSKRGLLIAQRKYTFKICIKYLERNGND